MDNAFVIRADCIVHFRRKYLKGLLSIPSDGRGARRPHGQSFRESVGPRLGHIVTTNRPCDSRDSISPSFDTYTNVLNDLTAIFRPIAVFMRSTLRLGRRALHSVELSRTRVAKAIRFSEVQETMFPRREIEARVIADTSLRRSIGHIP